MRGVRKREELARTFRQMIVSLPLKRRRRRIKIQKRKDPKPLLQRILL